MGTSTQIFAILVMMLATQLSRLAPLFLSSFELGPKWNSAMAHLPVAILSALVLPELFRPSPKSGLTPNLELSPEFLLAVIVSALVARISRSLLASSMCGVLVVAAWRHFAL